MAASFAAVAPTTMVRRSAPHIQFLCRRDDPGSRSRSPHDISCQRLENLVKMALEHTATAGAWPGHSKKHGCVRIGLCALVGLMGWVGYHVYVGTHKMHECIKKTQWSPRYTLEHPKGHAKSDSAPHDKRNINTLINSYNCATLKPTPSLLTLENKKSFLKFLTLFESSPTTSFLSQGTRKV